MSNEVKAVYHGKTMSIEDWKNNCNKEYENLVKDLEDYLEEVENDQDYYWAA